MISQYAKSQDFKNSILILRKEGTNDSTLLSDNFYYYLDSNNYINYVSVPFRFNEIYPTVDTNAMVDTLTKEYRVVDKYYKHYASVFKIIKKQNGLSVKYFGQTEEKKYLSFTEK